MASDCERSYAHSQKEQKEKYDRNSLDVAQMTPGTNDNTFT